MQLFLRYNLGALIALCMSSSLFAQQTEQMQQGKYLFQLANCFSCHTDTDNDGPPLAGGRKLESEFGTFVTPNITPHPDSGIGKWSDQDFIRALRQGIAPDGKHYFPAFPYPAYRQITDTDILALKVYLFSQPQHDQTHSPHQLKWFVVRFLLPVWNAINNWLNPAMENNINRAEYIINALGHCQECHTPRNSLGMLQRHKSMQGNKSISAPDLTTTDADIKQWSDDELRDFFLDGMYPDGDYVSDHMAEVVEYSTSKWQETDLQAVIHFLKQ